MAGKKFRFSLDSVLRLRSHETECAREELMAIARECQQQEEDAAQARTRLDAVVQRRPGGRLGPRSLQQHEAYRQAAQQDLHQALRRLEQLRRREEEIRATFLEKRAAEEALRTLHDEELTRHRNALEAAELEFLDEQAITSYYRQRRAANG